MVGHHSNKLPKYTPATKSAASAGHTTRCSVCPLARSIGNGLLQYRLGFIEVPKYLGAGASYLDVLILNACAVLALLIGIGLRYYHYRHERDFIRKYKIEGETGFKSIFSPSKSNNSGGSYNNVDSIDGD